jgi:hypothetical protein
LSSVSGIVKNWGACGSIAPPMTVDFMVVLPYGRNYRPIGGPTSWRGTAFAGSWPSGCRIEASMVQYALLPPGWGTAPV